MTDDEDSTGGEDVARRVWTDEEKLAQYERAHMLTRAKYKDRPESWREDVAGAAYERWLAESRGAPVNQWVVWVANDQIADEKRHGTQAYVDADACEDGEDSPGQHSAGTPSNQCGAPDEVDRHRLLGKVTDDGKITDAKVLKLATIEQCKSWYREAFGREWSESVAGELRARIDRLRRDREAEDNARDAMRKLREAVKAARDAVEPLHKGGAIAIPLKRGDDPPRPHEGGDDVTGGPLAHHLSKLVSHTRHHEWDLMIDLTERDIEGMRVDSAGLGRGQGDGKKTSDLRLLAYDYLRRNERSKKEASDIAKIWILLGGYPDDCEIPVGGAKKPRAIDAVRGTVKSIVPVVRGEIEQHERLMAKIAPSRSRLAIRSAVEAAISGPRMSEEEVQKGRREAWETMQRERPLHRVERDPEQEALATLVARLPGLAPDGVTAEELVATLYGEGFEVEGRDELRRAIEELAPPMTPGEPPNADRVRRALHRNCRIEVDDRWIDAENEVRWRVYSARRLAKRIGD